MAPRLYGLEFWLCYIANTALMMAVSVLFRYSDFVTFAGGSERELGTIVGVGMIGALAMRVFLGVGMDRYGPTRVWLASLALFIVGALAHVAIGSVDGPAVYLARILLTTGIAGAFRRSLTYVSLRIPEPRIAEMVGTLGTSGFLGLALGPTLGDMLFHSSEITRLQIDRMFYLAAVAGGTSWVLTYLATRKELRQIRRRKRPPLIALVRRYHPGTILLVAAAMGLGVGLPHVFLRAYAAELQFAGIKTFFVVYAAVAFTVRLLTRRWSQRFGIRPMILLGLVAQTASMFLYLVVERPWQLAIPATLAGTAQRVALSVGGSWRECLVSDALSRPGHDVGPGAVRHWQSVRPTGGGKRTVLCRPPWAAKILLDVRRGGTHTRADYRCLLVQVARDDVGGEPAAGNRIRGLWRGQTGILIVDPRGTGGFRYPGRGAGPPSFERRVGGGRRRSRSAASTRRQTCSANPSR